VPATDGIYIPPVNPVLSVARLIRGAGGKGCHQLTGAQRAIGQHRQRAGGQYDDPTHHGKPF
jgi:hypothetical protein